MKRKSIYSQQAGQIQQLEEEIKRLKGDLQTAQRGIINAKIDNDVMRGGQESHKDVLETEAQQKNLRSQMKNELDLFRKELALLKKQVAQNNKTETKQGEKK